MADAQEENAICSSLDQKERGKGKQSTHRILGSIRSPLDIWSGGGESTWNIELLAGVGQYNLNGSGGRHGVQTMFGVS